MNVTPSPATAEAVLQELRRSGVYHTDPYVAQAVAAFLNGLPAGIVLVSLVETLCKVNRSMLEAGKNRQLAAGLKAELTALKPGMVKDTRLPVAAGPIEDGHHRARTTVRMLPAVAEALAKPVSDWAVGTLHPSLCPIPPGRPGDVDPVGVDMAKLTGDLVEVAGKFAAAELAYTVRDGLLVIDSATDLPPVADEPIGVTVPGAL